MQSLTLSFSKHKILLISQFITFLCVIFALFSSDFYQNIIALLGILSFGILHGANDIKIIDKNSGNNKKNKKVTFFALYISVVILGIVIFYFIPGTALLSFVLVSCYHFGEQHFEKIIKTKKGRSLFYFSYGAFVFLMLFSLNYIDTAEVIFQISRKLLPFNFFLYGLIFTSITLAIQILFHFKDLILFAQEFFLLGLLALLFASGNLLFSFGVYFIVWHSLPSLNTQIKFLYNNNITNKIAYRKYLKAAFLYWVLALGSLAVAYFFTDIPQDQFLTLFFSFLAAITFPHAIVMERMFSFHRNQ